MKMDAKQFSWAYLIDRGMANLQPSYYGGYEAVDKKFPKDAKRPGDWTDRYDDNALRMIKQHGVNWNKTLAPESESHSQFQGTFCDSTQEDFLEGVLVLNGGQKIHYMAEPLTADVFQLMAEVDEFKAKYEEIFNCT